MEADREAIDLELGDVTQVVGRRGGGREAQSAADAGVERAQLVVAERVRQGQHRTRVTDLVERAAGRRPTDALRR